MHAVAAVSAAVLLSAGPVAALEPFLTLPLDCDIGRTCYIEDYVDADPGTAFGDYACGIKSRDGHRGTDFGLVSQVDFDSGVPVIAAAPGVVAAVRDGMADVAYSDENGQAVEGRECGNAVRVLHNNGFQTLYCHLARGSVAVARGDHVTRGATLGTVGMSGQSNYPHVHLTVIGPDGNIDPFAPEPSDTCGEDAGTLWTVALPYSKTGMFTAGFSASVPSFKDVKSGAARLATGASDTPLVLYSHFYHAKDGDVLRLSADGPEGQIFDIADALENPKASQFRAYGRKAPQGGWPKGRYHGRAALVRNGTVLAVRFTSIVVE